MKYVLASLKVIFIVTPFHLTATMKFKIIKLFKTSQLKIEYKTCKVYGAVPFKQMSHWSKNRFLLQSDENAAL